VADDKKNSARRITRKDRQSKKEIDHTPYMPKNKAAFPDLSQVDMPDPDAEALQSLKHMDDVMRPLVVTPQEDRYPPLPSADVDIYEPPKPRPQTFSRRPKNSRRNNFIAFLFFVMTLGVCGFYGFIWSDPQSILNPLAPATPFEIITATADTNPIFVPSPQPALADGEPTTTPSIDDGQPFMIVGDSVLYVSNQNGRECNWASIAGSVTNTSNEPLPGFGIRITGDGVSATVYSGTSSTFGAGGYEINLGSAPIVSTYRVQLVTTGGAPLSSELSVTTRDDCEQNVAIVNFVQR
jgi:hypothetical protein